MPLMTILGPGFLGSRLCPPSYVTTNPMPSARRGAEDKPPRLWPGPTLWPQSPRPLPDHAAERVRLRRPLQKTELLGVHGLVLSRCELKVTLQQSACLPQQLLCGAWLLHSTA